MTPSWQAKGIESVRSYFENVYDNQNFCAESMPWITGAVGIELQKLVIEGRMPLESHVLEIGCGIGTEAVYLAKQGMTVTAIDANIDIIELAKLNARTYRAKVDFKQVDLFSIDATVAKSTKYDFVIDQGCFHHIPPQERSRYAEQVNSALGSGGTYFLRGFSDDMPPSPTGDGPIRLDEKTVLGTFSPYFTTERIYRFKNIPLPQNGAIPQIFLAYLGTKGDCSCEHP